jgi:hypothetical protein
MSIGVSRLAHLDWRISTGASASDVSSDSTQFFQFDIQPDMRFSHQLRFDIHPDMRGFALAQF